MQKSYFKEIETIFRIKKLKIKQVGGRGIWAQNILVSWQRRYPLSHMVAAASRRPIWRVSNRWTATNLLTQSCRCQQPQEIGIAHNSYVYYSSYHGWQLKCTQTMKKMPLVKFCYYLQLLMYLLSYKQFLCRITHIAYIQNKLKRMLVFIIWTSKSGSFDNLNKLMFVLVLFCIVICLKITKSCKLPYQHRLVCQPMIAYFYKLEQPAHAVSLHVLKWIWNLWCRQY